MLHQQLLYITKLVLYCFHIFNLAQVSQQCKAVLNKAKDRMYYINKRIGEAQKSVAEYQKKVAEKQQYLHASDPEELLVEQKSE